VSRNFEGIYVAGDYEQLRAATGQGRGDLFHNLVLYRIDPGTLQAELFHRQESQDREPVVLQVEAKGRTLAILQEEGILSSRGRHPRQSPTLREGLRLGRRAR
jgi:hypothetical protein